MVQVINKNAIKSRAAKLGIDPKKSQNNEARKGRNLCKS
jgi:hypothetical protein